MFEIGCAAQRHAPRLYIWRDDCPYARRMHAWTRHYNLFSINLLIYEHFVDRNKLIGLIVQWLVFFVWLNSNRVSSLALYGCTDVMYIEYILTDVCLYIVSVGCAVQHSRLWSLSNGIHIFGCISQLLYWRQPIHIYMYSIVIII